MNTNIRVCARNVSIIDTSKVIHNKEVKSSQNP